MLFTPVDKKTGQRIEIQIVDQPLPRGTGWEDTPFVWVEELKTGNKYKITGKSCGLPRCKCDAWIHGYKGKIKLAEYQD